MPAVCGVARSPPLRVSNVLDPKNKTRVGLSFFNFTLNFRCATSAPNAVQSSVVLIVNQDDRGDMAVSINSMNNQLIFSW